MSSVLSQVGQNVADNLFEIGQSAVVGTAKALSDIGGETIEQVVSVSTSNNSDIDNKERPLQNSNVEEKKKADMARFQEVKTEIEQYIQRKRALDQKIAEETQAEKQQSGLIEKKKKDSWVNKMINRAQTGTEKGKMSE